MANVQVIKAIAVTAQIYGKEMSEDAARVYASDLSEYPDHAVLGALTRCRRELRNFPAIADIIARIDDGRPGPEEAWAILPKDEDSTVVWTAEMREAFGVCRKLLAEDPIAARMAFRETYQRLLTEARTLRRPTTWEVSLGHSVEGREPALLDAIQKGRLPESAAVGLIPDKKSNLMIEGPSESIDVASLLKNLKDTLGAEAE